MSPPFAHHWCDECWRTRGGEPDPIRLRVDPAVPCRGCGALLTLPALSIGEELDDEARRELSPEAYAAFHRPEDLDE